VSDNEVSETRLLSQMQAQKQAEEMSARTKGYETSLAQLKTNRGRLASVEQQIKSLEWRNEVIRALHLRFASLFVCTWLPIQRRPPHFRQSCNAGAGAAAAGVGNAEHVPEAWIHLTDSEAHCCRWTVDSRKGCSYNAFSLYGALQLPQDGPHLLS